MPDIRTLPRVDAVTTGTVMLLGDTGSLPLDIQAAIVAVGEPMIPTDIIRSKLAEEVESRGLQAEAGYSTGLLFLIFAARSERLATGVRVRAYLTVGRSPGGDAAFWNISVSDEVCVCTATTRRLEQILSMLRAAAGGPSTEITHNEL